VRTKPVGFRIVRLAAGHHPLILAITGRIRRRPVTSWASM
jgi:hypothetical protein